MLLFNPGRRRGTASTYILSSIFLMLLAGISAFVVGCASARLTDRRQLVDIFRKISSRCERDAF